MKNTNLKLNKTKLVARLMLVVILTTTVSLSLTSCGIFTYDWETYSHEDFVSKVNEYNSLHDIYVDTFISFDLDSNTEVSGRLYCFVAGTKRKMHDDILYDIYDNIITTYKVTQVFYLNGYACKIMCYYRNFAYNFTEEDKIEIKSGGEHFACSEHLDSYYIESLIRFPQEEDKLYENIYRYKIYVNDVYFGCIHISSIYKTSEEKLDEIIQMMSDSLVVLNTEKFFIWRDSK